MIRDAESLDIPVLQRDELAPDWQDEAPVLCVAGRTGLDEAAAAMLAQLLSKHGLAARVEGPDALSTANIFRLQTKGIAMACVSFMDHSSAAQMRYTIRRLRRKLPDIHNRAGMLDSGKCFRAGGNRQGRRRGRDATRSREALRRAGSRARR